MASEPDDYQTISDNCPGYMVLISAGIICTRCEGEKRHKAKNCPKSTTAEDIVTDSVPGVDSDGHDNADSGMESLSDTDSLSSESTASSEGSGMRVADAHQTDQGGSPQNTHLTRRGFARPDGNRTSAEPDRTSPSPANRRAARRVPSYEPSRVHKPKTQSRTDHHVRHGPDSLATAETSSLARSGTAPSIELSPVNKPSIDRRKDETQRRSRPHQSPTRQVVAYETAKSRFPTRSLADTTGKFDYSNTTCPSSFGFGRLPSEAMG